MTSSVVKTKSYLPRNLRWKKADSRSCRHWMPGADREIAGSSLDPSTMASLKSRPDDVKRRPNSTALRDFSCYVLLLVPIILFLISLYIPPTMISDSGAGFLALRCMLDGGACNYFREPDPAT